MGMFDEITVGRTYLKDLLTKEQEAIIKQGDDVYQTKDLKNLKKVFLVQTAITT